MFRMPTFDGQPHVEGPSQVAIIGGGWFGCHTALRLRNKGYEVTIYEKNHDIFSGISGDFGIRLHKGPHYPRSARTRKDCLDGFDRFVEEYPEMIIDPSRSVYALGKKDALGFEPKVDRDTFAAVCHEAPSCEEISPDEFGENVQTAFELHEPSIFLGARLRQFFKDQLQQKNVQVHLNTEVTEIEEDHTVHDAEGNVASFDHVINATSFKSVLPKDLLDNLPVDIQVSYQPCMALTYRDTAPKDKPFSFIVMDGWYPCIMPAKTDYSKKYEHYVVTHGAYTIMGSHNELAEAEAQLASITDEAMERQLRPKIMAEVDRFCPGFSRRFVYTGWKGHVLAKLKTSSEFRSALVFDKAGVIYIFPGKINNIFEAADEVLSLIRDREIRAREDVRWARRGALQRAKSEIERHPGLGEASTVNLQTFRELQQVAPEKAEQLAKSAGTAHNLLSQAVAASDPSALDGQALPDGLPMVANDAGGLVNNNLPKAVAVAAA